MDIGNNAMDIGNYTMDMGSGSVWFDASRTSRFNASNTWTTITYQNVRESSNSGAMDIGTGIFTAPLAGTYQFIIQAAKVSHFLLLTQDCHNFHLWGRP